MRVVVAAFLLILTLAPAWAGFDDGVEAYEAGNYALALKQFKAAAEQGDADAQHNVGLMYEYGLGVPADRAAAITWYGRAAENGSAEAQRKVGILYANGYWDGPQYDRAAYWYRHAAEQGDAEAERRLGLLYRDGQGVEKDIDAARRWLGRAAKQGDGEAARALQALGAAKEEARPPKAPDKRSERRRKEGRRYAQRVPRPGPVGDCKGGFPDATYDINVKIDFPEVPVNHDHSIVELGKMSGLGHGKNVLGLMQPDLRIETRARPQGARVADRFCFWIRGFDVTLRYRRVEVFVAREYPIGSCPYRTILAHEHEHVRIARKNLQEFAPRIRTALTSLRIPTGRSPAMVASVEHAKAEIEGLSKELLEPVYEAMIRSLQEAQAAIDTPQSYALVRRQCERW